MKLMITLEPGSDGYWIASCPAIPGCISQGLTREEAEEGLREAIISGLENRAARGLPLTVETRVIEVDLYTVRRRTGLLERT